MTTVAKIEANRRNAQLSTGPRTDAGKAVVARNATTHGVYALVPVVPGECPDAWDVHRAGVVAALAPVGLLEMNLAERAALVLWRLARLARYEAEAVAGAMADAEVPPLPRPTDPTALFPDSDRPTREGQLRTLRDELRAARRALAEVLPARAFFATEPADDAVFPFAVVETVLGAALSRAETADDLQTDPPAFDNRRFLRKLGLTGVGAEDATWTAGLIRRGVEVYADYANEPDDAFAAAVRDDLESDVEESERAVVRLEREIAAITKLLDERVARKRATKLLPGDGADERVIKYERHLHAQLTSTLHELERLQARRDRASIPPPTVADVTVTVLPDDVSG